jgi:tRNA (adenine22-N1)-methyltransferase
VTQDRPYRLPASDQRRPLRALPPRLWAVARLVPTGARVVDVGAACIAIERDRAAGRELILRRKVTGLSVRLGDGLAALRPDDRADVLVMSGLGTRAMRRVIEVGSEHVGRLRRLVLQPQTEAGPLRVWLVERGLAIVDERMTRERGRFYSVIAAEPRRSARPPVHPGLSEEDLLQAGPCLVRSGSPVVRDYWVRTLERTERLVAQSGAGGAHPRTMAQRDLATRVLAALDAHGAESDL